MLGTKYASFSIISPLVTLRGAYCSHSYYRNNETDAQRSEVTFPRLPDLPSLSQRHPLAHQCIAVLPTQRGCIPHFPPFSFYLEHSCIANKDKTLQGAVELVCSNLGRAVLVARDQTRSGRWKLQVSTFLLQ